jgi:hypothetical protein
LYLFVRVVRVVHHEIFSLIEYLVRVY